jgi:hypothetical protein
VFHDAVERFLVDAMLLGQLLVLRDQLAYARRTVQQHALTGLGRQPLAPAFKGSFERPGYEQDVISAT